MHRLREETMSSQVLAGQRLAVVLAAIFAVRLAMAQTDTAWQSGLPAQGARRCRRPRRPL